MKIEAILAVAALGVVGCGNARTPEAFAADTRAMLESKSPAIKECYDGALMHGARHAGSVVVRFTIQEETGKVTGVAVDPKSPPALGACVAKSIEGLTMAPPDPNIGAVTYTWEFTVGAPGPAIKPAG